VVRARSRSSGRSFGGPNSKLIGRLHFFKFQMVKRIAVFYIFLFFITIFYHPNFVQEQREKHIAVEGDRSVYKGYEFGELQSCLSKESSKGQREVCEEDYEHSCLTESIPPLWHVSFFSLRSCFECCVRFWMNSSGLAKNEKFWLRAADTRAEWMFSDRFTDWRFPESILGHSEEGEILLGQMSIALLADVAVFPMGNYKRKKKVNIIQATTTLSNLSRAVVLYAGCADGVSELLTWMSSHVLEYRVALFTRDDKEIGKKELFQWRRFFSMQSKSGIQSTWYIMNTNLKTAAMRKYNVRTFPLGIKFPVGFLAGLQKLEANAVQKKTMREKLLTCSSMKFTYSDRIQMRTSLERNGFNCHEGEKYGTGNEISLKKRKALNRKQQFGYVELLSKSSFFASPEGNGRDCYRHLEGISAGSILLARNFKKQDCEKFSGLPVLNFRSWNEVTREKLLSFKRVAYLHPENFDLKRAFFPWWLSQIL